MKTTEEPTTAYIDAAIERIEVGLDRHIRIRRRRTVGIAVASAAAVVALAFTVVGIAATHGVVTSPPQALGNKPLTAADVASWTSTPKATTEVTPVVASCEATLSREPLAFGSPSVISSDVRGRVQSAIVAVGDYVGYCIGTKAADSAFVLLDEPDIVNNSNYTPPAVAPDAINLGPTGANMGANGWAFAEGAVGTDVVGVTLHENGLDVEATVANGTWMAWWPTHNFEGVIGGTITITGADGRTSTVTPSQVQID